ncbi:MAG: glycosyltransferase WbuB [Deltaproteobacteria bacterium]|nr:MAG: glycosyltransferase WbuB [Deltaproteobacteria bacterium]
MDNFYRILIVSQYYYPDVTAAAFRIKETADILSSKGHQISVITAKPHKGIINSSQKIDDANVEVIRLPIIKYYGKGKWNYLAHYASFMLNALFCYTVRFGRKYDFVYATSPPLPVGLAGFLMSAIQGSQFILDIRDIWPDSAVAAGQLNKNSKLYKFGKLIEQWLYQKSDLITCVSMPMAEYIKGFTKIDKVVVIYNGVPNQYLHNESYLNENNQDLFQDNKINITYLGNMGYVQNLQVVLEAAKQIQDELPEVVLYLIGDGIEKTKLEKFRKANLLDNVVIVGPVAKEQAMQLMRKSSALFFQLKDDMVMEKTVPSKVFDYMTAGKPILFGIKGEGKMILEQVKGNIYYQPDSAESFINAVRKLKKNYKQLSKYARENMVIVEKYYTRENMVDKLEKHFQELFHY